MAFDPNQPYNDLPLLPPPQDLETRAVLRQTTRAARALAELKGAGELIPNPTVLLSSLVLQEAKLSSEIENIVTTHDELYRAFASQDGKTDPATKEVLSYNDALQHGYRHVRSSGLLTTRLFEELVGRIKGAGVGIRRTPGTKIANSRSGEVIYTPPVGESVIRDKLADLERFLYAQDDLDPLVKMAVSHYQFEAIHPFSDGNGRTGRILNILYLLDQGLLDLPVLYLSRYIIEHKADYYQGLRLVTEQGAWEDWVLYMLRAVEHTAISTRQKIGEIRECFERVDAEVRTKLPKIYRKELIELLFQQPYTKIRFFEEAGFAISRQTASSYLSALAEIGVLEGVKVGREWYYLNPAFLSILSR